jgi:predicted DNA-binding transcriptional regulator AlpA
MAEGTGKMSDQLLETLLNEKELSRLLGLSIGTLRFWRTIGRGPRYRKVGQLVRYAPSEVQEWLSRRPSGGEATAEVAR